MSAVAVTRAMKKKGFIEPSESLGEVSNEALFKALSR
jgi:hypothetical protein